MSMSDCVKCWDTPCSCGWDYRNYAEQTCLERIAMFKAIIEYHKSHPKAVFSKSWSEPETADDKAIMDAIDKAIMVASEKAR